MKRSFLVLAVALVGLSAVAQGLDALTAGAKTDLEKALTELAELRRNIEAEKLPLAQSVNALEQKLLDQKATLQKAERFQENQLVELNALKSQVRVRAEEVKYLESLLAEYARSFRTRLHVIEEERFKDLLARLDQAAGSPDLELPVKLERKAELIAASINRLRAAAGGETFAASALGPASKLEAGKVALLGPVALFAADQTDTVGLVQQELNKADPSIFVLDAALAAGARRLAQTGEGEVALDSTLGGAVKFASVKETLWEHTKKGGVVIWPMLALALASVIVAIIKWLQLSKVRLATERDLQEVLNRLAEGNRQAAMQRAKSVPGPAGELLATAIEHTDEKKEYIEEVLYEKLLATKPRLESLLPFIALTAAASPLLGLLGTVTGMISTFQLISIFGTGDPRTLSSGISEALITTEYGLLISIPALLAHAFLSRKAKGVLGSMEQTSVGFINGLPERREGIVV